MASYEWLKATLFQAKEEDERTDEEKNFILQHLTKVKDINRTPQQAKRDFIDSCQWSWNTEDCLRLMKEGLVPYDIVNSIIQETCGITNKFFSIFNSKTSLQSLIGSKHIAILCHEQDILALDPSDEQEKNNERIEQFFEKIKKAKDIEIFIPGTGGYAKVFSLFKDFWLSWGEVVFYPSNIPNWGAIATINGSKKRINEHKDNMKKIIDENRKKNTQETSNKTEILIRSTSYGNAMGVECSRILADEICVKHRVTLKDIARDFFIFQSGEDLLNGIKKIKNKRYIEYIDVPSPGRNNFCHPTELSLSLWNRIHDEIKVGKKAKDQIDVKDKKDSKDKEEEKNKNIHVINFVDVINNNKDNAKDVVNKNDKKDDEMKERELNNRPNKKTLTIKRQNSAEINNNNDKLNNTNSLNKNKDDVLSLH